MTSLLKKYFKRIQWHFIRDNRAKFGIPNSPQSPDNGQNSDEGISEFQISDQSLIKENCQNFRTSDDIDIKLGSVIKPDKKKKGLQKKLTMSHVGELEHHYHYSDLLANSEQSGSRIPDA